MDCMGSDGFGSTSAVSTCGDGLVSESLLRSAPLTVGKLNAAQGEVDNGRVLLLDKVVLREPLDVQDEVRGQCREVVSLQRGAELLRLVAVEFGEDG